MLVAILFCKDTLHFILIIKFLVKGFLFIFFHVRTMHHLLFLISRWVWELHTSALYTQYSWLPSFPAVLHKFMMSSLIVICTLHAHTCVCTTYWVHLTLLRCTCVQGWLLGLDNLYKSSSQEKMDSSSPSSHTLSVALNLEAFPIYFDMSAGIVIVLVFFREAYCLVLWMQILLCLVGTVLQQLSCSSDSYGLSVSFSVIIPEAWG